jgi:hypothetical protein
VDAWQGELERMVSWTDFNAGSHQVPSQQLAGCDPSPSPTGCRHVGSPPEIVRPEFADSTGRSTTRPALRPLISGEVLEARRAALEPRGRQIRCGVACHDGHTRKCLCRRVMGHCSDLVQT